MWFLSSFGKQIPSSSRIDSNLVSLGSLWCNNERRKMIPSTKQVDSPLQQGKKDETDKVITSEGLPSSSSPLLRSKDPRIVRVSRAFGGKDRHSKVFTVRGLRDRRVRLSVPTAIQLYDLQERLGLSQPSKVVDWLINEAKHEIEELPPLPNIPSLNHQMIPLNAPQEGRAGGFWRAKSKEFAMESSNEDNKGSEGHQGGQVPVSMPFGSCYDQFEPSNFGLSHIGSHGYAALPHSSEELHSNFNGVPLSSALSLSSGSQILDPRQQQQQQQQVNHFQMLMASGSQNPFASPPPYSMIQPRRPFDLSISPRLQHGKEHEFPSK